MSLVRIRYLLIGALILVAAGFTVWTLFQPSRGREVPLSFVLQQAQNGNVSRIEVTGDDLLVQLKSEDDPVRSRKERSSSIERILQQNDLGGGAPPVDVLVRGPSASSKVSGLVFTFLPLAIIGVLLVFMMRRSQAGNGQALQFGRTRARVTSGQQATDRFLDVAGQEEAKQELSEVVEFLKYPEKFLALGARIPHGVLLVGPPGTGKTMLARAVSGEAGVPFFSISASEFVEMFVGVGASRVRDLFTQAKRAAPAIVFVDEIDAVGRQRFAGLGGGNDEREQTLNQILVEMDGFDTDANVIIIAATNRVDVLDPALLRPGRFDRQVTLDLPDIRGRRAILDVHTKGKPLDADVSLDAIAQQTPGFSGADLANLVNEAAILAARLDRKHISNSELNEAVDRVIAGPELKSRVMTPAEKRIIAYHEGGHAVAAYFMPRADPPFKVTIVARGRAGGFTRSVPLDERHLHDRRYYEAMMAQALAGKVAEEMVFGTATTGAHSDIATVTQIGRAMVTQWGMSDRLGARTFGRGESAVFLGRGFGEQRDYSERTAREIDDEVRRVVDIAHVQCRAVLAAHRDELELLATRLLEVETVEDEELRRLFGPAENRTAPGSAPPAAAVPSTSAPVARTAGDGDEGVDARPGHTWTPASASPPGGRP